MDGGLQEKDGGGSRRQNWMKTSGLWFVVILDQTLQAVLEILLLMLLLLAGFRHCWDCGTAFFAG